MNKITVYTKPNCAACGMTKKFLQENNVPFESIDVTQNEEALHDVKQAGYTGMPVVAVDGFDNSWSGFRPDRIDELVEKRYHDGKL